MDVLKEKVDQIVPKLSAVRLQALRDVAAGRVHEVHGREISGLKGWDLIETAQIFGQPRPSSAWVTPLGGAVLDRLDGGDEV